MKVRRFTRTELAYHWAQALPFLALLATGALMLVQRALGFEVVRGEALSVAHRIAGCALPAGLFLVVLGGERRPLFRNAAAALGLRSRAGGARGKFNAGQRVNLVAQLVLVPALVLSGAIMWLVKGVLLAWYVHLACFLAATPLVLGHIYMAALNPATRKALRGIFTGEAAESDSEAKT